MSPVARCVPWFAIIVCGAIYGLAFAFRATLGDGGSYSGLSGVSAYNMAWGFRDYRWLANPAFWVAAFLLAWRMWVWAALVALLAFGIAVSSTIRATFGDMGTNHGLGYFLWTGSMGLMCLIAFLGWFGAVPRDNRRSPVEVFRGWQGVFASSWLIAGLTVLAITWNWQYLQPNRAGRPVKAREAGGVRFEFDERDDFDPNDEFSWGGDSLHYKHRNNRVRFEAGVLEVNGVDYGDLKAGDVFRLNPDATFTVNGAARAPYPIQPVQVNPTAIVPAIGGVGGRSVAWTPDSKLFTLTTDSQIRLWDVNKPDATLATGAFPPAVAIHQMIVSPTGKRVIAVDSRGGMFLWEPAGAPPAPVTTPKTPVRIVPLAFLDDDWLLEARGRELVARNVTGDGMNVTVIGAMVDNWGGKLLTISGDRRTIAWHIAGDELAFARVTLGNGIVTLTPGLTLKNATVGRAMTLTPDGERLFTNRGGRGGLQLLNPATGETTARMRWRLEGQVFETAAAFNPDATLLAVGTNNSVRVFDVASGRERVWVGSGDPVTGRFTVGSVGGVAFSPDGKYLAAAIGEGSGPKIAVWPVAELVKR